MRIALTTCRETIFRAEVVHDFHVHRFTTVIRAEADEGRSIGFRAEREAMDRRKAIRTLREDIAKTLGLAVEEVELS